MYKYSYTRTELFSLGVFGSALIFIPLWKIMREKTASAEAIAVCNYESAEKIAEMKIKSAEKIAKENREVAKESAEDIIAWQLQGKKKDGESQEEIEQIKIVARMAFLKSRYLVERHKEVEGQRGG
jgi:hypothetical protein